MLFGLEGPGVILAYAGSILATLLCVLYGIIFWNETSDNEENEIEEEIQWEHHDPELSECEVKK